MGRWRDPVSLNDTHDCQIRLSCACGHSAVWDGRAMAELFYRRRWDFRIGAVPRRFYCSRCKTRGPALETFGGPDYTAGGLPVWR